MTAPQQQQHSPPVPVPTEALQFMNSGSLVGSVAKGKRSKRPRHPIQAARHYHHHWAAEDEAPCSSLSEEQDLANCLVLLSNAPPPHMPSSSDSADRNFRCKTCGRNFHSHQALGGHASSHSKFKSPALLHQNFAEEDSEDSDPSPQSKRPHRTRDKVHECSVCRRIFPTGQALGGHMRSHSAPSSAALHVSVAAGPLMNALPDLNMPAPVDGEDDYVGVDDSAVSYNSPGGDVGDSRWPGSGCKMSPYLAPPWWMRGTEEGALFRYCDEADASCSGMLGGQDLDFQQGSVLVATVN